MFIGYHKFIRDEENAELGSVAPQSPEFESTDNNKNKVTTAGTLNPGDKKSTESAATEKIANGNKTTLANSADNFDSNEKPVQAL